jgi:antitoxin ParD1/3/4
MGEIDIAVLRKAWDEGKTSGRAGPLDIKRLIAEERAKLEAQTSRRG